MATQMRGRVVPRDVAQQVSMGFAPVVERAPAPQANQGLTGDAHTDKVLKKPHLVHGDHPAGRASGSKPLQLQGASAMTQSGMDGVVTRTFAP